MKHSIIVLILWCLLIASPTSSQEDVITLTVWGEPGPGCSDPDNRWEFCYYSRAVTDLWHAQHPNIRIEWENHGWDAELYVELQSTIQAGNPPDISIGEAFFPQMIRNGQLLPLQLHPDIQDNLIPSTVAYVSSGTDLYGVSVFTGVLSLELNSDVFYVAGLIPETQTLNTWGDVLETATHISEAGADSYYGFSILGPTDFASASLFRVAPYVYQTGANFCNMPLCNTPTLNDPHSVQTYEWFRSLYQISDTDLVFNGDEGYVFSQLFSGATAMQTAGSWHMSWGRASGCGDCRYLPLPLPEGGETANVVIGNAIYAVLATTDHPDEATMFLEWLASDTVQNAVFWTGVSGRLPTTYTAIRNIQNVAAGQSLDSVPEFFTNELGNVLEDAPAIARNYSPFIEELLYSDIRTLPFWSVEMSLLWNDMFTEVLTSERPVEEILDEYQALAKVLMQSD